MIHGRKYFVAASIHHETENKYFEICTLFELIKYDKRSLRDIPTGWLRYSVNLLVLEKYMPSVFEALA